MAIAQTVPPADPEAPTNDVSTTAAEQQEGTSSNPSSPTEEAQPVPNADTIVVTGIRRSLQRSQDIKRNSDVVVDSVTAEDISALPDRSVTEALQRIPGVAIDRFAAGRDPDHFSTEGSGVVVRGLTYVRSELNGRDTFSANNGRGLSFSDVPSELLGGVDVFKSPSADMVEGGIAGTVNLRTRVPFDQKAGWVVAGSAEVSWGDLRREAAPTFSVLAANRWDTPIGEFGLLGSVAYSKLKFRSDGIQISNYGARTLYSDGSRTDVIPFDGATAQGTGYLPRGAAMRSQETDRTRRGYSAAAQWRSNDQTMLATLQFLRSDSRESWTEHAIEIATDNVTSNGDSRAVPGTTLDFDDDGLFDNGVITGPTGWRDDQQNTTAWGGNGDVRTPIYGLQSNNIKRSVEQRYVTTDIGANFKWDATDRLTLNLDLQRVSSHVNNLDVGIWGSTFQNASIDMNGSDLPDIVFLPPEVCSGPDANSPCTDLAGGAVPDPPSYFGVDQNGNVHNSFSDPYNNFFRSAMDHIEDSDGKEHSARFDADYAFPETDWLTSIRAGVRYAKRDNVARFSTYNWGVLSEIWGGRGPVWMDDLVDGSPNTPGGFPAGQQAGPFDFPRFFRGDAGDPQNGDPRLFYSGDPAGDYEALAQYALLIGDEWRDRLVNGCPQNWVPLAMRCGTVNGTPFLPGEINPVDERNKAAYVMARFGHEFDGGQKLSGNIGVRYSHTRRSSEGSQVFNLVTFSTEADCNTPGPSGPTPFCQLPANVRESARQFANGAIATDTVTVNYDYWLPAFNAKLEVGNGLQFRAAFSKSITPPEFGLTRNYYLLTLAANQEDIEAGGGLPIARATVGNPYLKPIEGTNFDLTAEWYFAGNGLGQLSASLFYKRLKGVLTNGVERIPFTNNGATFDALVTTPVNSEDTGKIKGFELAYQQVYNFLPGALSGLGFSASYTFVDSSGVSQSTLSETDPDVAAGNQSNVDTGLLPLQGLSKHTLNLSPFYEYGPWSVRLAYNWRSKFLLTARDVIVPFAPILNNATGQLDGSIFYSINDKVKLGVQGVNLLNEVTKTSQVLNNDLLTAPRSWFMNDRRFTGILRVSF
ncbi:TonB-dependent receptor [Sphingomonas sabuli]|uniref:TonB-dependent receptor n=1 Tax=Sphingomonas sabuli TaxID=2764186 RepID=UPI001CA3F30B|nr:TonB-dependent receptor [Sphingomonas sabuli]